jgi:membrane fusion protein, multidrug efflux system
LPAGRSTTDCSGTVNAAVVIAQKTDVVMVPEQSVVLRPAGKVVYAVAENRAKQVVVETGVRKDGLVEILKGLEGGETIALDGAGFLTDNAPVALSKPPAAKGEGKGGDGKGKTLDGPGKDGGKT